VVEPVETTGRAVVERWLPVVEPVETTPGRSVVGLVETTTVAP
jgi:hypothetical protein